MTFASGAIIASAIFAFIIAIGLLPRIIYKADVQKYVYFFESLIVIGALFGVLIIEYEWSFNIPLIINIYTFFIAGIFTGCLAMSIAEVIDVIPVVVRRFNLYKHVTLLIVCIGLGKGIGSFIFYFFGIYTGR